MGHLYFDSCSWHTPHNLLRVASCSGSVPSSVLACSSFSATFWGSALSFTSSCALSVTSSIMIGFVSVSVSIDIQWLWECSGVVVLWMEKLRKGRDGAQSPKFLHGLLES